MTLLSHGVVTHDLPQSGAKFYRLLELLRRCVALGDETTKLMEG